VGSREHPELARGKPHPLRSWDASRLPGGLSRRWSGAQPTADPFSRILGGLAPLSICTPAGSVEDPAPCSPPPGMLPGEPRDLVREAVSLTARRILRMCERHPAGAGAGARRPPGMPPGRGHVSWCSSGSPLADRSGQATSCRASGEAAGRRRGGLRPRVRLRKRGADRMVQPRHVRGQPAACKGFRPAGARPVTARHTASRACSAVRLRHGQPLLMASGLSNRL